jgi:lysyl-tRNA synthetase class 2
MVEDIMRPMPPHQPVTHRTDAALLQQEHLNLPAGAETAEEATVAGRVLARRDGGRIVFLDLHDRSGTIQLQARADAVDQAVLEAVRSVHLGDWVTATGTVMRSRRGELTIAIREWRLLTPIQQPLPDRQVGILDDDLRQRFRERELLGSAAARERYIGRARMIAALRRELDADGFIEAETPILQACYGGAHAEPFVTHHASLDQQMFLRISPELALRRLMVAGLERVYELGRVFRNEGLSPRHNPEFTLLEWYESYADEPGARARTAAMVTAAAQALDVALPTFTEVDYLDALVGAMGEDPRSLTPETLQARVLRAGGDPTGMPLDELFGALCESNLPEACFVTGHPMEISPLAAEDPQRPGQAARFELYLRGIEVANGYQELNEPVLQRARTPEIDPEYLEAIEFGFPPTAGVGIGVDRLWMTLTGADTLRDGILFPTLRARPTV